MLKKTILINNDLRYFNDTFKKWDHDDDILDSCLTNMISEPLSLKEAQYYIFTLNKGIVNLNKNEITNYDLRDKSTNNKNYKTLREQNRLCWIAKRIALRELLKLNHYPQVDIDINKNIEVSKKINLNFSTASSYPYAIAGLDKFKKLGIDIIQYNPNIFENINTYFSQDEKRRLFPISLKELSTLVSIKKSVYKAHNYSYINIKNDIKINYYPNSDTGFYRGYIDNFPFVAYYKRKMFYVTSWCKKLCKASI